MGNPRLSLNATPNSMNVYMDTGNPQLNCTLDSVLKISGVHTYIDFFSERMLKMKNRP